MPDYRDLDPTKLKPGLVEGGKLKPSLTTDLYTGGTPSAANQVKRSIVDASGNLRAGLVHNGKLKPSLLKNGLSTSAPIPTSITEYWEAGFGMFQDAGMTSPVTAAGQAVARWVGRKSNTVLTLTAVTADLVGGVLVPKGNADNGSRMQLPNTFVQNRQDITVAMHIQRPGCFQTRAIFGFDKDGRACDMLNYGSIRTYTYDGTAQILHACTAKASPCTVTFRNNSTNRRPGINGVEILASAGVAGTLNGGSCLSLSDGSVNASDRVWAIALGPYLNDIDYSSLLAWANGIRARPSESAPSMNLGVFHDSQGEGNNAGRSWILDLSDANPNLRIIPVGGSGQHFYRGSAQSAAAEIAQLNLERVAGAGRNVVIFSTTNDFNGSVNGTNFGTGYAAAMKTTGQALIASGWEVWVCKFPHRAPPFTSSDTFYNANVDTCNGLTVSDPWMTGTIDFTSLASYLLSDGTHWAAAGQGVAKNIVATALGLN